jgi:hypothetical protein
MLNSNFRHILRGRGMFSFFIDRKIIKFLGGLSPPWQKILASPLLHRPLSVAIFHTTPKHIHKENDEKTMASKRTSRMHPLARIHVNYKQRKWHHVFSFPLRNNIAFPGQTRTVVNDRIRRNTTIYMMPYYDRISPCRMRRNTAINGEENGRLRSSFMESVYDYRFALYFSVYGHGEIRS